MKLRRSGISIAALTVMVVLAFFSLAIAHMNVPLLQSNGNPVTSTTPYSPKVTCGGCHFDCSTGTYSSDKLTWCDNTTGKEQYPCESGNCPDYASMATKTVTKSQGYIDATGKLAFTTFQVTAPMHGISTGKHSTQGRNDELTTAQRAIWGAPGFITSPGMAGRY
jgi:hypothetical protein